MRLAASSCNPALPGAPQHHSCFAARSWPMETLLWRPQEPHYLKKTQGFMPESVCTREFRRFRYTSQLLVDDDDDDVVDVDVDVVDSVMWLTC